MNAITDTQPTGTALETIEATNLTTFFTTPGGLDAILDRLEKDARSRAAGLDPSTEKGRKAIASLGLKVAKSKTALDDAGAELKADWLAKSNAIDAERRTVRTRLDTLRTEIDRPVVEYKAAEAARIKANEDAIAALQALTDGLSNLTCDEIKARHDSIAPFDWSVEFKVKASQVIDGVVAQLRLAYADAKQRAVDAAAEAQRAAEQAERDRLAAIEAQRVREEAIAQAAAAKATADAEAKAAQERKDAAEAVARADARAEAERLAAAERARRDQQAAIDAERAKVAAAKAAEDAETARRAADKEHRGAINREVLADIIAAMSEHCPENAAWAEKVARSIVTSIAKGQVRHVAVAY